MHSNSDHLVPGYAYLTRRDFFALKDGGQLTDPVVNEIGIRIAATYPQAAVLGTDFLVKMATPGTRGFARPAYWTKRFGNDAALGTVLQFVIAPHHVPGHWCLAIADLHAGNLTYFDSSPPCGLTHKPRALRALSDYVMQVDREQEQQKDASSNVQHEQIHASTFNQVYQTKPDQPDGVSCGVCILMMTEHIAQGRFYDEPAGHFTAHEVACFRARLACVLLHSPELNGAEGVALARRRADNSTIEIDVIDLVSQ